MITNKYLKECEWRRKNPDRWRKTVRKAEKKYRKRVRNEIFTLLGAKCNNPFNIDHSSFEINKYYIQCLQIDHVNDNGCEKRKEKGCGISYLVSILKEIKSGSKDYQLLCPNCNWIKRHDKEEITQKI